MAEEIGREKNEEGSGGKMVMYEKIAPKRNIFDIWVRPLRAIALCHTFSERSFYYQHLPRLADTRSMPLSCIA